MASSPECGRVILVTWFDVRVGWKSSRTCEGKVEVEASKEKVSKDGAGLASDCLKAVAEGLARGACPIP
jgi:hypothetical protein